MADLRKSQTLHYAARRRWFLRTTQSISDVVRKRVQERRHERGLTQSELAQLMTAAGVPLTGDKVSKLESGKRSVGVEELFALAWVLDVPLADLVRPLDGEPEIRLTQDESRGWNEVANWIVWGREETPDAQEAQEFMRLLYELIFWTQAIKEAPTAEKATYRKKVADVILGAAEAAQLRPGVIARLELERQLREQSRLEREQELLGRQEAARRAALEH